MSDGIKVYPLSEVRTMSVRDDPQQVVLRITAGGLTMHYGLRVEDLQGLARQMTLDAKLLE